MPHFPTLGLTLALAAVCFAEASATPDSEDKPVPPALNFTMDDITGKPIDLSQYQGKVVLMVNTASECGLTPQYKQLQELHEKYSDEGLAILGFPANNFGGQEPGTNEEIQAFCKKNFGVEFQMFSKVSVKGDDTCKLYQYLTGQDTKPVGAGDISWNFEKFLIGRDGQVVALRPKTKPDAEEVIAAIEKQLEKPA